MSRSATNIPVLSFTETVTTDHSGSVLPDGRLRYGAVFQNFTPWPTSVFGGPPPSGTIIHHFSLTIVSTTETYYDFTGAVGTCGHLPYGPGATAHITESWVVNGVTTDTSRTISWASTTANLYGVTNNEITFVVYSDTNDSHVLAGVTFMGQAVTFADYAYSQGFAVVVQSGPPGAPIYTTVGFSLDLSASGSTMSSVTTADANPYFPPAACSGLLSQTITGDQGFRVVFKPVSENGDPVTIPCTIVFPNGSPVAYSSPYTIARTSPVDETFGFTGEATNIAVSSHRYDSGDLGGFTLWPPGGWGGPNFSNFAGVNHNRFTAARVDIPLSFIGPRYDATLANHWNPPAQEMYVRHWWHPAAGSTAVTIGHVAMAASVALPLAFALVGSPAGASVVGAQLTAAAAAATFRETLSATRIAPRRYMKFDFTASAPGTIDIGLGGTNNISGYAAINAPSSSGFYNFPVVAGPNTIYLDLCSQPVGATVPQFAFAPIQLINSVQFRFQNNVLTFTGIAAVVKSGADFRSMGGVYWGSQLTPFYGQCDGNVAFWSYFVIPAGNRIFYRGLFEGYLSDAITQLSSDWGLTVSAAVALPPVPFLTFPAGLHTGYAASFDSSGVRLAPGNPVAGVDLKWTAYQSSVSIYAGCGQSSMFGNVAGGDPFRVQTEFIYGGVCNSAVVPPSADPWTVQSAAYNAVPQVWAEHFSSNAIGYARKAYAETPNLFGGSFQDDLFWAHQPSGISPTFNGGNGIITDRNRGFHATYSQGYPHSSTPSGAFPWTFQDGQGRLHLCYTNGSSEIVYRRSTGQPSTSVGWVNNNVVTSFGDCQYARMAVDPLTKFIHLLVTRKAGSVFSVWKLLSTSDGADFDAGVLLVSNGLGASPWQEGISAMGYTWFLYNLGTSGPGSQQAVFSVASGVAFGSVYAFKDSGGSPIQVADGGWANVTKASDYRNALTWAPILDGDVAPTVHISTDHGHSWMPL